MSMQPLPLEHVDLREYADQLLETARVEYVDEGVLLVMAPAGPACPCICWSTRSSEHGRCMPSPAGGGGIRSPLTVSTARRSRCLIRSASPSQRRVGPGTRAEKSSPAL